MRHATSTLLTLAALLPSITLMSCDSTKKSNAGSSTSAGATPPATTAPTATLQETYWKLTEVDGRPAVVFDGSREAHMVLRKDGSVSGSSSVNRMMGSYTIEGDSITFGQMAGSMMAGPEPLMKQEQAFLKALGNTKRYRVEGETLTLVDANGNVVAKFVAVYL